MLDLITKNLTNGRTQVLVLGAYSSGTSLLTSILGSHPECGFLVQNHDMAELTIAGKRVIGNKLCIPQEIQEKRKKQVW